MAGLTRRGPSTSLSPVDAFDRMFQNFLGQGFSALPFLTDDESIEAGTLAVDVSEDDENVIVRASLPGFNKDDVSVELDKGVLTITGEHTEESESKGERYYRRERRVGSVSRRIALPGTIGEGEAEAEFKGGVLTVRVPRATEADSRKKLKIK